MCRGIPNMIARIILGKRKSVLTVEESLAASCVPRLFEMRSLLARARYYSIS